MGQVVLILLGLALLGVAAACWTGRWRAWSRVAAMPHMPIVAAPAGGFCFLLAGIGGLLPSAPRGVCYALAIAIGLAGMVLLLWGPKWYGPRWFRERDTTYDLSVPLNAAMAASVRTDPGAAASEAVARAEMGGAEPLRRWRAHLISDEHGRPSAMQRIGVVRGHLLLYPEAVVFAADVREDRMRGSAVTRVIAAKSIVAVSRVAAGTRADGSRSGPDLPSRVMPRLRIDTTAGPLVFETAGAARRVRELQSRYLDHALPAAG